MTADRPAPPARSFLRRLGTTFALAGALGVTLALPAQADSSSGNEIERYDVQVDLAADGTMAVRIEFAFDFGDDPGHGPYLTLPSSQRFDADYDRVYEFSDITAASDDPSTAPDDLEVTEENGWLQLRIGDPDVDDVRGVHRYTVTYTARGLVNAANATNAGDELNWNVLGGQWEIPLNDITVTIDGPAAVEQVGCFAGPFQSTSTCDSATADGVRAQFTQHALAPQEGMTVATSYAPGTFTDAAPILRERWTPVKAFALTPWTGGTAAVVLFGGLGLVLSRIRQRGRDEQYLDQVPGLAPQAGQPGDVRPRDRRMPIAVHFTPPAGFQAGQLGTLIDERADPRDVTASIVDLAVRGYLRIEQTAEANFLGRGADWSLVQRRPADDALTTYERTLLDGIFAGRSTVALSELKATFAATMATVQGELYEDVTARGWFRGNPKTVRTHWLVAGLGLAVLGAGLTVLLAAFTRGALVGVAVFMVGVVLYAVARNAPARTAAGTAVLGQTLGFRQYLATAEAEQLRFEEGEDLFSRYLPYAIVFGLTERWAAVFARLAAQGRAVAEPTWYGGPGYGVGTFWLATNSFGHAMESFSAIATQSISAPTPGSSGRSGFSGGFSGGGVGGGGGGGW
ncbi:DUF2207 domain-containing protein [Pengzhenrongella frigida]|uniref:DUF2207 domain-containing protein n=1 Tax=Pengzhenrongella frigida TaxID=1259133 RepID=A0A4Q5MVH0_9MICO|nr:DUF2207 domain-containing protein [Cellulomonas sp. HLT2-17]RYV49602.1 DUF2207 domain-containing protein [Cellulomonas sp. HLT2-17]